MSPKTTPATTRPSRGQMTGERSIQFGPSSKRVLARLRPERTKLSIAVLLGVASGTAARSDTAMLRDEGTARAAMARDAPARWRR